MCPFLSFGYFFSQENWDFEKINQKKPLFLDTRAINGHTVKLLEKKVLELRIIHRFGDIATNESYRTLFGLDNSSDIRIGLEYGLTDKIMIGAGRSKGAGPFLELWDAFVKAEVYNNKALKLKISWSSKLFFTTMKSSKIESDLTYFSKLSHRATYHNELLIAFKPIKKLTLQLSPGFIFRNLSKIEDKNCI